VTLATKDVAYLFGSVQDFEKQQRAPTWIYPAAGWQIDDAIGSTWGYTTGMTVRPAESVVRELFETASTGGNLLLNVCPATFRKPDEPAARFSARACGIRFCVGDGSDR